MNVEKTIEGYGLEANALAAALICAGEQDVRQYLNGVYLDFPNGRIVSTDGHRLFCGKIEAADCEPVIVPRELVEQALKARKGVKVRDRMACLVVSVSATDDDGEKVRRVSLNVVEAGARLTDKAIDAKYPDYERVIPLEPSGEVGQFNAEYLADAQKALRTFGGLRDSYMATIEHNGPNSACLISMTGADAFCVVMPVRGPDSPPCREWYTAKPAKADAIAA